MKRKEILGSINPVAKKLPVPESIKACQRNARARFITSGSIPSASFSGKITLKLYKLSAHDFTMKLIREVLASTGITATAGIGTNLYLAKIAMDIVAKHIPADKDADQPDLFTDYEALEKQKAEEQAELDKEKRLQQAIIGIKNRMGQNAILKGTRGGRDRAAQFAPLAALTGCEATAGEIKLPADKTKKHRRNESGLTLRFLSPVFEISQGRTRQDFQRSHSFRSRMSSVSSKTSPGRHFP